jgi:hypothetical protein
VLQYSPKDAPLGRNFETKGWSVDENDNLTFKNTSLLACPSTVDSTWYLWLSGGNNAPAGQKGCLGFSARTLTNENPVKCSYSVYSP